LPAAIPPAPAQALDDDYTLWALWVWIYCIVWWLIQDTCKVAGYWIMNKLNVFQINTAKLVNMREAQKFSDKPLARASAGLVEVRSAAFSATWRCVLPCALCWRLHCARYALNHCACSAAPRSVDPAASMQS
jgi:hypothetical protein